MRPTSLPFSVHVQDTADVAEQGVALFPHVPPGGGVSAVFGRKGQISADILRNPV